MNNSEPEQNDPSFWGFIRKYPVPILIVLAGVFGLVVLSDDVMEVIASIIILVYGMVLTVLLVRRHYWDKDNEFLVGVITLIFVILYGVFLII